jgi:hypothetical protein
MSSHVWPIGAALLSHACSACATYDRSSMVASTTGLARAMQMSNMNMDWRFDGYDGF